MDVPIAIGETARAWDEQHLDLRSAARQAGDADPSGFTDGVVGSARTFVSAWRTMIDDLAAQAESRADGLRDSLEDYLATDAAAAADLRVAAVRQEIR